MDELFEQMKRDLMKAILIGPVQSLDTRVDECIEKYLNVFKGLLNANSDTYEKQD
jgi:hypothetical protein